MDGFKVLESISSSFDNGYIDYLSKMPLWKPGMIDGKPVNTEIVVPMNICLTY